MLAQTATSAPLIGGWVIGAIAVLQLISLAMQVLRWNEAKKREVYPQPLEVKGVTDFLAREQFDQHVNLNHREHESIFARLGGVERGIRAEVKKDIDAVHEKVNEVGREVSALTATTELQNQRLAQIDAKIDRLSERRIQ